MPSIIVGLFDELNTAEQVVEVLLDNDIPGENISMVVNDNDSEEEFYVIEEVIVEVEEDGFDLDEDYDEDENVEEVEYDELMTILAELGLDQNETGYYAEEVNRGRTMVAVNASDDQSDRVKLVMNEHFPVDMRERPAKA